VGSNKLEFYLEKIIATFEGKYTDEYEGKLKIRLLLDRELEHDKIYFSAVHYEKTADFLENTQLYQQALEKIKEKYKYHLVNEPWFNPDEIMHREIKRESYCQRFNLQPEDLAYVDREVKQRISEENRRAEICFLLRDDNCSVHELEEVIKLEEKYGSKEQVAELEKKLVKARAKFEEINQGRVIKTIHRNDAKWDIACDILANIKFNVNPFGRKKTEAKYEINWFKKLDLLKEGLKVKGIYLNRWYEADIKHDAVIKQIWQKINDEERKEWQKKNGFAKNDHPKDHPSINWEEFTKRMSNSYRDPRFKSVAVLRSDISQDKFFEASTRFYTEQVEASERNELPGLKQRIAEIEGMKTGRKIREKSSPDKGPR